MDFYELPRCLRETLVRLPNPTIIVSREKGGQIRAVAFLTSERPAIGDLAARVFDIMDYSEKVGVWPELVRNEAIAYACQWLPYPKHDS